jgi:hypothetical protein
VANQRAGARDDSFELKNVIIVKPNGKHLQMYEQNRTGKLQSLAHCTQPAHDFFPPVAHWKAASQS